MLRYLTTGVKLITTCVLFVGTMIYHPLLHVQPYSQSSLFLPLPSYDYFIFLDDDVPGMLVHARVGQHCYECVATTGEKRGEGRGNSAAAEDEWTVFQGFLLRELPLVGYVAPMQDSTFHGVDDNDNGSDSGSGSGSDSGSGSGSGPRLVTRGKAYVDAQLAAFHRTAVDGILLP